MVPGGFDESEPTQAEKIEATKQYIGDGVYVTYDGYHVCTPGGANGTGHHYGDQE